MVLALPEDHELSRMTTIPFTALNGVPILMISSQTDSENVGHYLAMAAEVGITLTIAHEVDQLHIALALAAAGLGVTFVPAFAATMLPPGLVTRPITGPEPTIQTQVLIRRGRPAPLLRNLLESLDIALDAVPVG